MTRERRTDSPAVTLVVGAFVDVVTEEDDDVRNLVGEVSMSRVVAGVPVLARRHGDVESADGFA